MDVPVVLHMNEGVGDLSYHRNSLVQKKGIQKTMHIIEENIAELCRKSFPNCLTMAELGCSSGPTSLLPLEIIIETIDNTCQKLNKRPPVLQVFLNDLSGTDFNTIFRSLLPEFHERLKKEKGDRFTHCFVGAMPGSFHGRLFPPLSLHFVHSSYTLHYLSQVPGGFAVDDGNPLNKGNILLFDTSPPSVRKAYSHQFKKDFTIFLKARSEEIIFDGRMTITLLVHNDSDPGEPLQLIGSSLKEMVEEGLMQESILDSCNFPTYFPSTKEILDLVKSEGSFSIAQSEEFNLNWDSNIEDGDNNLTFDKSERAKFIATYMRAVTEPMLVSYCGSAIIDDLFHRFSLKVTNYLEKGIGIYSSLVLSMVRK